jgi:hypothetical protein
MRSTITILGALTLALVLATEAEAGWTFSYRTGWCGSGWHDGYRGGGYRCGTSLGYRGRNFSVHMHRGGYGWGGFGHCAPRTVIGYRPWLGHLPYLAWRPYHGRRVHVFYSSYPGSFCRTSGYHGYHPHARHYIHRAYRSSARYVRDTPYRRKSSHGWTRRTRCGWR